MSTRHDDTTTKSVASPEEDGLEDRSTADQSDGGARTELPLDIVFEIIRNERRRLVLEYLEDVEDQTTLSDLAEHIAAIENDTTVEALSAQQRKRVYVGLYQCHLPKMADSGVVEFNKDRGIVRPGPNVDQLEPYLNVADDDEEGAVDERWYPALTGVAVAGYLLAAFGGFAGQLAGGVVVLSTVVAVGSTEAYRRLDSTDDD